MRDKLLAGKPLRIDKISIRSPTLSQIADVGFKNYLTYAAVCANDNIFGEQSDDKFYNVMNYSSDLMVYFHLGLYLFTGEQFLQAKDCFYTENDKGKVDKIIDKNNYDKIVDVLRLVSCTEDAKTIRSKELDEKIAKAKQKLKEKLGKLPGDDDVSFNELVSVVAAKGNGLNIMNIWRMTYYQFNDQFKRMNLIENYDISVKQVLAGFENVKPEPYIGRIN